jgi:hypothetical protein
VSNVNGYRVCRSDSTCHFGVLLSGLVTEHKFASDAVSNIQEIGFALPKTSQGHRVPDAHIQQARIKTEVVFKRLNDLVA